MKKIIKLFVDDQDSNKRLDIFISSKITDMSRTRIKNLILDGSVKVNNKINYEPSKKIINMGPKNVLLKGGHLKSKMIFDILATKKEIKVFPKRKIITKNTHGTGCTLSSALATCLSQKKSIFKSCKISLKYVDRAITYAPGYGKGFGPLNHLVLFNSRNTNV